MQLVFQENNSHPLHSSPSDLNYYFYPFSVPRSTFIPDNLFNYVCLTILQKAQT